MRNSVSFNYLARHTSLGIIFAAHWLNCAVAKVEEPPLPYGVEHVKSIEYSNKLKAAKSALRVGLGVVAVSLYEQLIAETEDADPNLDQLLLGLATAQMSQGNFQAASVSLNKLTRDTSPKAQLMRSMLAYHRDGASAIRQHLKGVSEDQLPVEERGWFHLMSGLAMMGLNNLDQAELHFAKARDNAVNDAQRTEFRVLRYRTELTIGDPDEVLAVRLKQQWEKFQGKSASYDFALEYASVLQALNRSEEAIKVISTQLKAPNQNPLQKAHLLLILGLLDQNPRSSQGREALEELVVKVEDTDLAKVGLSILAERFDPQKQNAAYVAFLDRLLNPTEPSTPHPLRENLLLLRARAALRLGSEEKVEEYCSRLMQEYPASPWRLDALRALATIAWRTNPPKYRTAANYLKTISEAEKELGEDFSATALLMADCHFLAKDYDNASSVYNNLLGKEFSPEIRGKALFQYVKSLIEIGNLEQAIEILDKKELQTHQLQSWWRAEWNLVTAIRMRDGPAKAYARIKNTLQTSAQEMPEAANIRLTWLQAQLSLDLEEVVSAPELSDKILSMLSASSEIAKDSNQYNMIRAQTLLTKGQALLRLKQSKESFEVLNLLREENKKRAEAGESVASTNEIVALSYLLEANYHSAHNHLAEAQRTLVTLVDLFPNSSYAPRALYEASINAERRGLSENLKEAKDLLELLATRFKDSDLLFYARLRQGHLLRKLGEFGPALDVYNEILRPKSDDFSEQPDFSEHPDLPLAKLSQADCMLAMANNDPGNLRETAQRYEDLFRKASLPVDFRIEAGCKRAACLRKANSSTAQAAYWEVIDFFKPSENSTKKLGGKGRYWASRTIFELGEILEQTNSSDQALKVYSLIHQYGLPGEALAKTRAGSLKD